MVNHFRSYVRKQNSIRFFGYSVGNKVSPFQPMPRFLVLRLLRAIEIQLGKIRRIRYSLIASILLDINYL